MYFKIFEALVILLSVLSMTSAFNIGFEHAQLEESLTRQDKCKNYKIIIDNVFRGTIAQCKGNRLGVILVVTMDVVCKKKCDARSFRHLFCEKNPKISERLLQRTRRCYRGQAKTCSLRTIQESTTCLRSVARKCNNGLLVEDRPSPCFV